MNKNIRAIDFRPDELAALKQELDRVRRELLAAESELAEEQAAVNAFRMHCRLKLDAWINRLLDGQTKRESLKTRFALLRQAQDYGLEYDDEDPFWQTEGFFDEVGPSEEEEALLLPTDTPKDKAAEKRLYRQLARRFHPDLGVTAVEIAYRTEMMAAVNTAYEAEDIQTLYDLADELDPEGAAELTGIESKEVRDTKSQILRIRQRTRKSKRRLANLRKENTARLWQKARHLDNSNQADTHWWEIVRQEIEKAIERVEADNIALQAKIEILEQIQPASPPETP